MFGRREKKKVKYEEPSMEMILIEEIGTLVEKSAGYGSEFQSLEEGIPL